MNENSLTIFIQSSKIISFFNLTAICLIFDYLMNEESGKFTKNTVSVALVSAVYNQR